MKVLSLFSGVGGFDMGLEAAGMTTVFQCEIDKHCQQTLRHHWPDVPKWDDVSTLTGAHILSCVDGVDVVAWGSPCQDLSVAGKRAGLAGERSGLFHEGIRIIKELRELSNGTYPTWSIWENVAGALSSNGGADFGQVLSEMDEAGACFSEWAVLDAQHFGIPQRRRRVFVISCFDTATASRCPEPLLPVGESRTRNSAKGKPTRQDTPGEVADRVRAGGEQFGYTDPTLSFDTQFGSNANVFEDVAPTMKASQQSPSVAYDEYNDTLGGEVHHALRAGTRQSTGVLIDAAGFKPGASADARTIGYEEGLAPSLEAGGGGNNRPAVLTPTMVVRRLTPIECERLMGWPEYKKTVTIAVCTDPAKNRVSAEIKSLRKQSFVGNVEKTESAKFVSFVESTLSPNFQKTNDAAELNVLLNLGAGHTQLTEQNSGWQRTVSNVELNSWFVNQGKQDVFAQVTVLISGLLEKMLTTGKVAKPTNTTLFIHPKNGLKFGQLFGDETRVAVKDAMNDTAQESWLSMSTTSEAKQSSPNYGLNLATLCCSVLGAIGSFIPEQILTGNSFDFSVTIREGHTLPRADGKTNSDTTRYKMCGNGVASPVAQWIAQQIINI